MIETEDLTSYIPGYEKWLEEASEEIDNIDFIRDELLERKEQEKMERKVIDLNTANMTINDVMQLENYVWKNNKLIPCELLEEK